MTTSKEFELKDFAEPLHHYSEEQLRFWAEEISKNESVEKCDVRVSERGTHIYVDYTLGGREISLEPAAMGEEFKNADELQNALQREWDSRERSRAYVRGEIEGSEFEGKYTPPEIVEDDLEIDR